MNKISKLNAYISFKADCVEQMCHVKKVRESIKYLLNLPTFFHSVVVWVSRLTVPFGNTVGANNRCLR